MTAKRKKAPKRKRAARQKRWGRPAKPPRQKIKGERLKPISLHPLEFEEAVRRLLSSPTSARVPKSKP